MRENEVNCWELNKCGREPGGEEASERGTCPAATDTSFNGINRGINGGRVCWAVAGTFCGGKVQGSFAEKRESCLDCSFFKLVQTDEGTTNLKGKFLSFISRNGKTPFFKTETYTQIKSGERFITQGEVGDKAYIIQRGSCLVIVEKNGELHPVDHYGEGDIVGGMGILTGEPHLAHVEAETDMEVWVISKTDFDSVSKDDPDLLEFLTEFVANRLDSRRPAAYRTIGKYIAKDIIGRGGFSLVYEGVHSTLNMPVAIKMLRHNLAMQPDFLSSFHHEAKTIASLNHENIIKIYDIEERFKTVFIIMELLEGERLLDLLVRIKRIPLPLAVDILLQACNGLDYAHRRGIIHRDVTTDNIFLLPGNRVKVIDFGLSCPVGTEDYNLSGTASYMSPEQIEGDPVDPRTDIYGLGIIAYEMVTGKQPFFVDNTGAVLDMHLRQDIPDPTELVPDLPVEMRTFILNASRRDPDKRLQNVGECLEVLSPLGRRKGVTGNHVSLEKQKMTNIFLMYKEGDQKELNLLMEEFSTKIRKIGVVLKASEICDLEM